MNKKKKKDRLIIEVSITYPANEYYLNKDQELQKLVGRIANDSGLGMGERDLHWHFKSPLTAIRAFSILKKYDPIMRYESL